MVIIYYNNNIDSLPSKKKNNNNTVQIVHIFKTLHYTRHLNKLHALYSNLSCLVFIRSQMKMRNLKLKDKCIKSRIVTMRRRWMTATGSGRYNHIPTKSGSGSWYTCYTPSSPPIQPWITNFR